MKENGRVARALRDHAPVVTVSVACRARCFAPRFCAGRVAWLRGVAGASGVRMVLWFAIAPRSGSGGPPPNKPMHPTANSAAFIVNLALIASCARRVIAGVSTA